jgi:hypothetical protein
MIPKGLKVGDTFDDCGITYRVTKVVGDNYESAWVGATPPSTVADSKEDYLSMPYATLKKLCADRGLDARGSKADLIARLEG